MSMVLAFLVGSMPALDAVAGDATGAATLALLGLTLALLARVSGRGIVVLAGATTTLVPAAARLTPPSTARVTDPVRHPRRPRAPGLV